MLRLPLLDLIARPLRRVWRLLSRRADGFAGSSRGSVSVELVIVLPLLLWALAATVVFFDGFKQRYQAQMAAQTVADIMSRNTEFFTAPYVEGQNEVFDFLANNRYPTRIRVSSVIWDSANERNRLQWSYGTRGMTPLPADTFELMQAGDYETLLTRFGEDESFSFTGAAAQMPVRDLPDRVPPVLPGEALLVVEAFALWEPFVGVGVGRLRFTPVVVVRPRFAPWINFEGVEPIFPEADYELAWTGSGNESLPDPGENTEPPEETPTAARSYSFEDGVTTGFSHNAISSGGPTGSYLGPFGPETWDRPVTLDVDLLTAGTNATISFDLLIIDTWDGYNPQWSLPRGDTFTVMIDGVPISLDAFSAAAVAPYANSRLSSGYLEGMTYSVVMERTRWGTNFTGSASNDQVWRVVVTLENAPRRFALGFSSGTDSPIHDESWGLDNLTISASGTGSPAPFVAEPSRRLALDDPHTRFRRYSGCPEFRIGAPWLTMTRSDLATGITMQRLAGGDTLLSTCSGGVVGYANASPHLVLNYDNQGINANNAGLLLQMEDNNNGRSCDTTLIVRDPNGQWFFNDDYSGWNAGLQISNAAPGQYVIFIGTYSRTTCNSNLSIGLWTRGGSG